jgi:hypothetical protein
MIRDFKPEDEAVLRAIHEAQGFDYVFPDLNHPQFVGMLVAVDENDVPVQAVLARKTVEVYFLGRTDWRTPAWRMEALTKLHLAMHGKLLAQGYTDAHAWLPPEVARTFGRRLKKVFGWVQSRWTCFAKEL